MAGRNNGHPNRRCPISQQRGLGGIVGGGDNPPIPTPRYEVEIFADERCQTKPTGEVSKVFALIGKQFGFDDAAHYDDNKLVVSTPTTAVPTDKYSVNWYDDFNSQNFDEPLTVGQVIRLGGAGGDSYDVTGQPTQFGPLG